MSGRTSTGRRRAGSGMLCAALAAGLCLPPAAAAQDAPPVPQRAVVVSRPAPPFPKRAVAMTRPAPPMPEQAVVVTRPAQPQPQSPAVAQPTPPVPVPVPQSTVAVIQPAQPQPTMAVAVAEPAPPQPQPQPQPQPTAAVTQPTPPVPQPTVIVTRTAAPPVSEPTAAPADPSASPLMPALRLSPPSLGASSYVQRVKAALITLSQSYPEVQSAQAAANTSGFEVESAKTARYPRLKVGTSSGKYNAGSAGTATQDYNLITAEVRMSLLDGGAMSARERAAEAGNKADEDAVSTTSQKVVLDALTAYLQVQRFELKKEIAHKSTEVVADLSKAEARRVALGVSGQNDLNMAASRRASIAARELDFEAQRDEAIAKFKNYFKFIPDAQALPVVGIPLLWRISSQDEALRRAEARSTELTEAQGRIDRARALADQQEASIYPTLDAVIVKTKDPHDVSPQEPTRTALELNWNLGSGFDQQLRLKSALAEVANQESKLEGVKLNLFELTSASWSRTVSGREREKQLMDAVSASGQAFRGRQRLMEFGRETLPNVLDAQLDYYNLLFDYVDAVFDLRITELRLARTTGELRVVPDSDNMWIDRIFGPPGRPVLTDDGMLGVLCLSSTAACASEPVLRPVAGPGADGDALPGLALRRTPRLSVRVVPAAAAPLPRS